MHKKTLRSIGVLKATFDALKGGKESLLTLLEETELPESVYNSNAIENSTLTLEDTEKILLHHLVPANHSQREIFEAINLAKVTEYLNSKVKKDASVTTDLILLVHGTLLIRINEEYAGRFRRMGEYVRVGRHIAPAPEDVPSLMAALLDAYHSDTKDILQRIVEFHLEFERIHPFCDGNGRVGRALLNFQLKCHGYPPIIIRNKAKHHYYAAFRANEEDGSTKEFEHIVAALLKESLHKRIAYLRGDKIVTVSEMAKTQSQHSPQSITVLARKQSLPAFRERGRWKVGEKMFIEWCGDDAQ
jgi:Fic family protein